jgi:RNA polymerase sigma-70 factor, ECF subfamily
MASQLLSPGSKLQSMLLSAEDAGDEDLVRRAGSGDREAFGELYRRHARTVHGILLARVPFSDAEDMVQDVFLSAMRQLKLLRTPAAFRGWLIAIARHRAIDYYRQERSLADLPDDDNAARAPSGAPPEAFLILDAIRGLPEAYRETLVLRLVEGMTGPEIAERTGMTHPSVRVNLSRGMKMLRERLQRGAVAR